MTGCNGYLEKLNRMLPDLASPRDLVKAGIYGSSQSAYAARKMGKCPMYLKIPGKGIVYPREAVLEFIKNSQQGILNCKDADH